MLGKKPTIKRDCRSRNSMKAQCDRCKTYVDEGKKCSRCGKYMPTGDQIADYEISKMERYSADFDDDYYGW